MLGDHRKPDDQWDFMLDKDKKIGYVRITSFIQNTADELQEGPRPSSRTKGCKGLILDLRDNPGGLLSAAVEVSDLFLDEGEIVSTKGRNTTAKAYEAQKDRHLRRLPDGRPGQPELGLGLRDRLGLPPGPQAGHGRRPAVLRQGLGAEHPRARRRQQRAQADRRELLPALGQEHPPLQERQGPPTSGASRPTRAWRSSSRPASTSTGSSAAATATCDRPPRASRKPAAAKPEAEKAKDDEKAKADDEGQGREGQGRGQAKPTTSPRPQAKASTGAGQAVRRQGSSTRPLEVDQGASSPSRTAKKAKRGLTVASRPMPDAARLPGHRDHLRRDRRGRPGRAAAARRRGAARSSPASSPRRSTCTSGSAAWSPRSPRGPMSGRSCR